ncbi:MAG: VanW family protein [Sandaracinaceae bacterium]|nr:VanW family protein [Sandaracinaceae bacterium]
MADRLRVVAALLAFAAAGVLGAWVLAQRVEPSVARAAAPAATVEVAGEQPAKGEDPRRVAERIAARWAREPLTLTIPGAAPIRRSRAAFGASLDVDALAASLDQALDATSAMRRLHPRDALSLDLPVRFDDAVIFGLLADVKDGFDQRPEDARFDLAVGGAATGTVRAHTHGRRLDVHRTLDAIERALARGDATVAAAVERLAAHRTAEELGAIDVSQVLGAFETRYSTAPEARDRTFNLAVAGSKIDGLVILPGETFDFNAAVGERSEANGFRPAPVIAGGELVDGVGGGTCQVAGTLHAAAFFAGLPIVERSPHSRPSSYIFMGLDAVVSYPQLNLRFQNDLDFPIVIGFRVEGGYVRAELRGAATRRLVTFVRRVDDIAPYVERDVPDASLPRGTRVLRQRGVPGFTVTTFRIVRDVASNQAVRTRNRDVYPPTQHLWTVGAGGAPTADFVTPAGDTHNEYTADEYLEVSQGEGVRGTRIVRRAGRSGTPGWTARMGLPQPPAP